MAEERKIVLEREYIVPLREEWLKVPEYKRANKAVKALKEFLARHMKIYDRDLKKIRVDILLNNEIRFRGMRYPPAKIKVKAIKYEDGTVDAKLVQLPKHIEFEIAREARRKAEIKKTEASKAEVKEEKPAVTEEVKEKEESSKEAMQAEEKKEAKQEKHTSKTSLETPKIQRKALKR